MRARDRGARAGLVVVRPERGAPGSPCRGFESVATAIAIAIASSVLVGIVSRIPAWADRELSVGLLGVGASLWIAPILTGLPDSPGSAPMFAWALTLIAAASYVPSRLVRDPTHALGRPSRAPWRAPALGLTYAATLAWCAYDLPPDDMLWTDRWPLSVAPATRLVSIVAASVFATVTLMCLRRERALEARLSKALDATVVEPGSAELGDGRRIRVPTDLDGPVTVLGVDEPPATYRQEPRGTGTSTLAGSRASLLAACSRRIAALDILALTGPLAIAAPASASLGRRLVVFASSLDWS